MKKILSLLLLSIFTIASYAGTISIKDWYGTGFALKEGYVVTNYHVVDGATHVYIKGVGGDFSQEYAATVVEVDKENDLAIVKIEDSKFTSFGNIPYPIQTAAAEIGEDIFVLGYPMTDVMGEEIKLTTGVINSCSGYKGDNRSYQISAPIQPGNSGGPLFNKKGEVIGVVNAKLLGAENAGYAIKAQYLSKYLDTTSNADFNFMSWVKSIKNDIRHFFTKRSLSNQSLVEQVKMIKNHVFIVKCCLKPKLYKIEYTTTNNKKLSLNSKKSVALHTFEEGKGTVYLLKPIVPECLFIGRRTLKSIVIKNGITSIGDNAFQYCTSLKRVDISDLSAWCKISFGDSSANPLCNGAKLYLNGSELTDITIPSDITEIKDYAFEGFSSLTSVTIGNSVTSIGSSAFYNCTTLTSITIPNSVTTIGYFAFSGCTGELIIDSNALGLYGGQFTKVIIGDSVTSIGDNAFNSCTSLTRVTIGNSVTSIGKYAFYGCTSLTSVTIGNSVTSIGRSAFDYCKSLKEVYCKPTTPPGIHYYRWCDLIYYDEVGSFPFYSGMTIYIPRGSYDLYSAYSSYSSGNTEKTNWSKYKSYIKPFDFN